MYIEIICGPERVCRKNNMVNDRGPSKDEDKLELRALINDMYDIGMGLTEIGKLLGVVPSTVYYYVKNGETFKKRKELKNKKKESDE